MESSPSNKTVLPENGKLCVEQLSGIILIDVKVHFNSTKQAQLKLMLMPKEQIFI